MKNEGTKVDLADEYSTSDLAGSAVLITLGYQLIRISWSAPKKALFIFQREEGVEDVMNDYWSNVLRVDPRKFWENVKMIKNRLYENRA